MEILLLGLFVWSFVHFIPSLAQPVKKAWINAMGDTGYKITFSLIVVLSLVLIVYGWRHTVPIHIYDPVVAKPFAIALMVVSFLLFGAAKHPSIINSWIRHPQLTGLILWSTAHLLANGDSRSVMLFGSLAVWECGRFLKLFLSVVGRVSGLKSLYLVAHSNLRVSL